MTKTHKTEDGYKRCTAKTPESCPIKFNGEPALHFPSMKAAREYEEDLLAFKNDPFAKSRRKSSSKTTRKRSSKNAPRRDKSNMAILTGPEKPKRKRKEKDEQGLLVLAKSDYGLYKGEIDDSLDDDRLVMSRSRDYEYYRPVEVTPIPKQGVIDPNGVPIFERLKQMTLSKDEVYNYVRSNGDVPLTKRVADQVLRLGIADQIEPNVILRKTVWESASEEAREEVIANSKQNLISGFITSLSGTGKWRSRHAMEVAKDLLMSEPRSKFLGSKVYALKNDKFLSREESLFSESERMRLIYDILDSAKNSRDPYASSLYVDMLQTRRPNQKLHYPEKEIQVVNAWFQREKLRNPPKGKKPGEF